MAYYRSVPEDSSTIVAKRARDYLAAEEAESNDPQARDVLLRTAKAALGTPYVRGGTSRAGFDCSGFVQWTFNHVGVKLPRTAREQSQVGRLIRNQRDMQVGDIVAFRHPRRGYHTGIYVGDGKFIHSPRKRTRVRINALSDPYFSGTFLGARRIEVNSEADIAAAEKMLAEYRSKENARSRLSTDKKSKKDRSAKMRADKNDRKKRQNVASRSSDKDRKTSAASRNRDKASSKKDAARSAKPSRDKSAKSAPSRERTAKGKAAARDAAPSKKNTAAGASSGKRGSSAQKDGKKASSGKATPSSKKNAASAQSSKKNNKKTQ